jgi:uncharacterized integral membrane protein (TIGR00697 family)
VKLDARLGLFITLVAVFMTCLVVGNLTGSKLSSVWLFDREWAFSVGQIAFPITFILTDILNEFYGRKVVRRITLIGFFMIGLMLLIVWVSSLLPFASFATEPNFVTAKEFDRVFTQAMWIQVASMIAFLIGNLIDISVFFVLKKLTRNRMLWLRATGSTAVSQLVDTVIITAIAFGHTMTLDVYVTVVLTSYAIKLLAAISITPLLYAIHAVIERTFGIPPAAAEVASAEISS